MAKEDVLLLFETDLEDPGSIDAGYLMEHVLMHAERVIDNDRQGLIDALDDWLERRTSSESMLAAEVVKEFKLSELREKIQTLRDEVAAGDLFLPYYLKIFDDVLAELKAPD